MKEEGLRGRLRNDPHRGSGPTDQTLAHRHRIQILNQHSAAGRNGSLTPLRTSATLKTFDAPRYQVSSTPIVSTLAGARVSATCLAANGVEAKLIATLRRRLLAHLRKLQFVVHRNGCLIPPSESKHRLRALHKLQRDEVLSRDRDFIVSTWPRVRHYFANGLEVDPTKIAPRVQLVESGTDKARLFRLAALTWSVPVSQGYGRRMRFLVWDDNNGKLIGLIALGDPVFNLKARDEAIGWSPKDREARLVHVLDAYVLGAVPPYNMLLGGKLVASLIRTREIRDAFRKRYGGSRGLISKKSKRARLALITVTSALGRSSVYNRLTLSGRRILESVGYTSGWGHFHIPADLFSLFRQFLAANGDKYAGNHGFGDGPNWRLRAVKKALSLAGLSPNILRHGVNREVFLCFVAVNARGVLKGTAACPRYGNLPTVADVGQMARERWIIPRAGRRPSFRSWRASMLLRRLQPSTKQTPRTAGRNGVLTQ